LKRFNWNSDKNEILRKTRSITFEEIVFLIENGLAVDIIENKRFKNQHMFAVNVNDYIFLVPFVENAEEIFLKTIYPSRKATKKYLIEAGG
jgi:hypothetical protein